MNPPKHTAEKLDVDRMGALSMRWIPVSESLPDDEETVLIAMADGEAWTGFHCAGRWHYVSGDPVGENAVAYWTYFPDTPFHLGKEAA